MELNAIEPDEQCDQIWRKFAPLAKNQSLAVRITVDLVLGKI